MINNLSFITGRETGAFMPQLEKKAVDFVRPSTILPELKVALPKKPAVEAVYTSPFASVGNVAAEVGKKLNIAG